MANNKLDIRGGIEFMQELANLPAEMDAQVRPIAVGRAEKAKAAIHSAYPEISGELRAGLKVIENTSSRGKTLVQLVNTTYYAGWYEFGTKYARPHPTFYPISRKERGNMREDIAALLRKVGFRVTGD